MRTETSSGREATEDEGFSLVELVVAAAIMMIVMTSLAYVTVNSVLDTAFARQRNTAVNLANQAVEEVRALPWSTVILGHTASDICGDGNVYPTGTCGGAQPSVYCFEDQPMVVGAVPAAGSGSSCSPRAWSDPTSCLNSAGNTSVTLSSPAPLSPHQQCFNVSGRVYAVDAYLTGTQPAGNGVFTLTLTVVVSWAHPGRTGLADHVVSSTELSNCKAGRC
jgi:type II secretory pathway pseudopilin PulG